MEHFLKSNKRVNPFIKHLRDKSTVQVKLCYIYQLQDDLHSCLSTIIFDFKQFCATILLSNKQFKTIFNPIFTSRIDLVRGME